MKATDTIPPLSRASIKPSLLNDRVTDFLRDAIVTGRISPGSRLVEREVCELLDVSRAPVRDALLRLETEGLIVSRRDGRYVITLDEQQVECLYSVRRVLENYALELAVPHVTDDDIATLEGMLAELREAYTLENKEAFGCADMQWHEYLWSMPGNAYLARLLRAVHGPVAMVVGASTVDTSCWQRIVTEHEALYAAVSQRDTAQAIAATETHLRNACVRLVGRMREAQRSNGASRARPVPSDFPLSAGGQDDR